jgi:hypothetical protein
VKVGKLPESLPAVRTRALTFDDLDDLLRQIRESVKAPEPWPRAPRPVQR